MHMPQDSQPRKPPRFVPTLTERINVGEASSPASASVSVEKTGPANPSVAAAAISGAPREASPSLSARATQTVPSQRASLQEPDSNFAARMAALRDKQSTALNTSNWLIPSARRTARPSAPEHSPQMAGAHGGSRIRDTAQVAAGAVHAAGNEPMENSGDSQALAEAAAGAQAPRSEVLGEYTAPLMSAQQASELEEMLAHRVLQRVDIALEQQLHKAIAAVVQAHSASLLPKLRDEVENVVRRAVNEAVSVELASQSKQV